MTRGDKGCEELKGWGGTIEGIAERDRGIKVVEEEGRFGFGVTGEGMEGKEYVKDREG